MTDSGETNNGSISVNIDITCALITLNMRICIPSFQNEEGASDVNFNSGILINFKTLKRLFNFIDLKN